MKFIKIKYIFYSVVLLAGFCACHDDDVRDYPCDDTVLVSRTDFDVAPNDDVFIRVVSLSGDCLHVEFAAGGCDGSTWIVKLIDANEIAESQPPQRSIRLSLDDDEDCEALISKELSFDITELRVDGNEVILHMTGWDTPISYTY